MRSLLFFMASSPRVSLSLTTQTSLAQSFDSVRLQRTAPGQDLAVAGLVMLSGPSCSGSGERRDRALPLLDYQWANGWFVGVSDGVGIDWSSNPQWRYDVRVTADLGGKERRATALRGMGNVQARAEGDACFDLALPDACQARTPLRYGSGAGFSAVNADPMQICIGVDAIQTARSGYTAYTPRSGSRDTRVGASLTYALDPRSAMTAAVDFNRLLVDAADSPLTRRCGVTSAVLVYSCGV